MKIGELDGAREKKMPALRTWTRRLGGRIRFRVFCSRTAWRLALDAIVHSLAGMIDITD